MNRLRMAGLSLALLVLSAQAGAGKPRPSKVKKSDKAILTLAMDGPRVAYMWRDQRVAVWNVTTGATSTIKGEYSSPGGPIPTDQPTGEVAIAGKRVAFITRFVTGDRGATQERLYTAPLGGSARQIGTLTNHLTSAPGYPGFMTGDWIAGVVGSGKALAVSTWTSDNSVSSDERLSLITPKRLRTIATGPGAIVAESAAGGRIAVFRSTLAWPATDFGPATTAPTVGVYSADGTLLREITPSSAKEIAFSGKRLVVLTKENTFEVYKWTTGEREHTWRPIPIYAPYPLEGGHLVVYGKLAVYAVNPIHWYRKLHLLDVTTGKDVVIAIPSGSWTRDTALGLKGLVYIDNTCYRRHWHGKLVFVPMAKLLEKLK
jgi:hypothetical protein